MEFIQSKPFILASQEEIYFIEKDIACQFYGFDNEILMVKTMFDRGAIARMPGQEYLQVAYIVSGRFKVTIDGNTMTLKAGDGFYVEREADQECVCLEEGEIIKVYNPADEELLARKCCKS